MQSLYILLVLGLGVTLAAGAAVTTAPVKSDWDHLIGARTRLENAVVSLPDPLILCHGLFRI